MNVSGKAIAWLTSNRDLRDLRGSPESVVSMPIYSIADTDMTSMGWTRIGVANISLELDEDNAIVDAKIAALRLEQTAIRARAEAENTRLEGAIQKLLAIGFDAPPIPKPETEDIPF